MIKAKKSVSFLMLIVLLLSSFTEAFAGTSLEEALNKVSLYVKEDGTQLLTWQGIVDAGNFAAAYIVYKAEDGKEYPAYCGNPNRPGVDKKSGRTYDVDIDTVETNPHVWGVITNGHPYKTPQELGVRDEYESYYITKMAVWATIHENYSDISDWKANGSQNEAVETAMKALYAKGQATTSIPQTNISVQPSPAEAVEDDKDSTMFSQVFTITSDSTIGSYTVSLGSSAPSGAKVTDLQNNPKTTFSGSDKFKVLIPKTHTERKGTFEVIINAQFDSKAILYGLAHDDGWQNYYVVPSSSTPKELNHHRLEGGGFRKRLEAA